MDRSTIENEEERRWHPEGAVADEETLQALARAWALKQSAFVRSQRVEGRAVLLNGEPRDPADLELLVRMVYAGAVEVRQADSFGSRVPATLAPHLWHAAGTLAGQHVVDSSSLDATLVDGPTIIGVGLLPISHELRRLLAFRDNPRATLRHLLVEAATRVEVLGDELSRVIALGALRLRKGTGGGTRPRPGRPRRKEKPRAVRPTATAPLGHRKVEQMRARLEREIGLITDADDWTVVGVSPGMPPTAIQRACERMTDRYARMMDDERLPDEVRDLAQEIHARVLLSVGRINEGNASAPPLSMTDPMAQGHRFLEEGRPDLATKCFAKARQDTSSPMASAWLGWAVFASAGVQDVAARQKGRELVELATNTSDFLADPAYLMARIDFQEGNLVRSWNWLEKAMKIEPDHQAGGALLLQVRAEINKER
ncbi:MAG: hypothetical protein GY913_09845 [Proteobacteria bacterium]|nr:hypothetical protein [Pseudomonadota bacterium]MCP4917214.1 hypothetical protein [Pseudomonadota bacterium]